MSGTSTSILVPVSERRHRKLVSSAIDATNEIQGPVDFSFYKISQMQEFEEEDPKNLTSVTVDAKSGKWLSRSLMFNNNRLVNIACLPAFIESKFAYPENIAWIDLSLNALKNIDPVLSEIKQLQILYLHGNQIDKIHEVDKLASLKCLRNLTLHRNKFEKAYKNYVIAVLPKLVKLDFAVISKENKKTAETWKKMAPGANKKKNNSAGN